MAIKVDDLIPANKQHLLSQERLEFYSDLVATMNRVNQLIVSIHLQITSMEIGLRRDSFVMAQNRTETGHQSLSMASRRNHAEEQRVARLESFERFFSRGILDLV